MVRIEPWSEDNFPLLEKLLGDPRMTEHLGGPERYEVGWSTLPAFQGRGIAGKATSMAIALAREDGRHRLMHAFPSIDNAPSNAICRKLGFTLIEECDFEYPKGSFMRCNDWRLDLY